MTQPDKFEKYNGILAHKQTIQRKQKENEAEQYALLNQSTTVLLDAKVISRPMRKIFRAESAIDRTQSQLKNFIFRELAIKVPQKADTVHWISLDDKKLSKEQYYKKYLRYFIRMQALYRGKKERKQLVRIKKNFKHRRNVLRELISTETSYVNDLGLVVNSIIPAVSTLLSKKDMDNLFGNIKQLYELNKQLIDELSQHKDDQFDYQYKVVDILVKTAPFFRLYSDFYKTGQSSQNFLKELNASSTKFVELIKSQKQTMRGLGLEGFLIKPVQRLPKYELLLRDFVKHTEQDHPLLVLYEKALMCFVSVIQQNDELLSQYMQNAQLSELKRLYGDPNNIKIIEPSRKFIKEEKLSIVVDNKELSVLVYVLSDLILICERDDKSESGYKLHKTLNLGYRSSCQSMKDGRFQSNLCKLIGDSQTIIFTCETPLQRDQLVAEFQKQLGTLKERQSTILTFSQIDQHPIEVEVKGTQEREKSILGGYIVYIVEISIGKIVFKIDLRYSELKQVDEMLAKSDFKFPRLSSSTRINNKEAKLIEGRKFEIEQMLQHLLSNEQFQQSLLSKRVLETLKLDVDFYDCPSMLIEAMKNPNPETQRILNQDRIPASQLFKLSGRRSTQVSEKLSIPVPVKFADDSKVDFQINETFRASDFIQLITTVLDIQDAYDFRLFDEDRPLLDDELVVPLVKKQFSKNKSLLFKKYLFLPSSFDVLDNPQRIRLILQQNISSIQSGSIKVQSTDLCVLAAIYCVTEGAYNYDLVQKVLPPHILKTKTKTQWGEVINAEITKIQTDLMQYADYQFEEISASRHVAMLNTDFQRIQQIQDRRLKARLIFNHVVQQAPNYGVTMFKGKCSNLTQLNELNLNGPELYLGVSYYGIQLHDYDSQSQIWQFEEIKQTSTFNDQFIIRTREKEYQFMTYQGIQIQNLYEEYQFLKSQVNK